jgi:capsular polysaccharide transport system permease protein
MSEGQALTSLDRARRLRLALGEVARLARRSSRGRRSFDVSTSSRRRAARFFSLFYRVTFFLLFVLPAVASAVYFGLVASPQYVVETRFTVQGGEAVRVDGLGILTGLPSLMAIQDTQIVTNYIHSSSIVESLQKKLDLRKLYGNDEIDLVSRLSPSAPFERLLDYWNSKVSVSIELPGGIVVVTVRAFSPSASYDIANEIVTLSENLVNDMNKRIIEDNAKASRVELERSTVRVVRARLALEKARNAEGLLDATLAGHAVNELITGLRGDRLRMQQEYDIQLRNVSETAPQMRNLKIRMKAVDEQIAQLEATLTRKDDSLKPDGQSISGTITKFSELELENRIAEKQYTAAAVAVALSDAVVQRRLVYLQTFMRPSLPDGPRLPRRGLNIFLTVVGAFTLWATLCGIVAVIRNHMA